MKTHILSAIVLACLLLTGRCMFAQSSGTNYLQTKTHFASGQYITQVDYCDGLGRPYQTVLKNITPTQKSLVTLQEYDNVGRENYLWLPVPYETSETPVGVNTLTIAAEDYYPNGYPYNQTVYEKSPLNRIEKEYGAGSAWRTGNGHFVKTEYPVYGNSTLCANFRIHTDNVSLRKEGNHSGTNLDIIKTTDEDGNVSYVFKDLFGHVLLQRQMLGSDPVDTYFVYDDYGNLRFVLPPLAADALTQHYFSYNLSNNDPLQKYAYYYEYDNRQLCVKKKLPGCDPVIMRYDKARRMILSQDGNQKTNNLWTFYLYDQYGRQVVTGIHTAASMPDYSNTVVTATYTGSGPFGGYQANISLSSSNLLIVDYYDSYSFISNLPSTDSPAFNYSNSSVQLGTIYNNGNAPARGLQTGRKTYIFNTATPTSDYIVKAFYYDADGRIVRTHSTGHVGNFEHVYNEYSQTGKLKKTNHVHINGSTTNIEKTTYAYDAAERLISVKHQLNNNTERTVAAYDYNELGQLTQKALGNGEIISYTYNIRGWPTNILSTHFYEHLNYTPSCYNGNISKITWTGGNNTSGMYTFTYDNLSRLTKAEWGYPNDTYKYGTTYSYDKMGNILTLKRDGGLEDYLNGSSYATTIDDLTMTYNGNQLINVTDAHREPDDDNVYDFFDMPGTGVEYTYDKNGNMTKDLNKQISSIQYNLLNLPHQIGTAKYVYSAEGMKLNVGHSISNLTASIPVTIMGTGSVQSTSSYNTGTNYCGNFIYQNSTLKLVLFDGGYITFSGTTPQYHYYLQDHLGNNRIVLSQSGSVEQTMNYYPFGCMTFNSQEGTGQPFRYNGKEYDTWYGINWHDYGARYYDQTLGRWHSIDPMAEKYYSVSPYAYCANNPINSIDRDGMDSYYSILGDFLFTDDNETDNIIIRTDNIYGLTNASWLSSMKRYNDTPIQNMELSANAYSKIFTHIMGEAGYALKRFKSEKIEVAVGDGSYVVDRTDDASGMTTARNAATTSNDESGRFNTTATIRTEGGGNRELFSSVSNVVNILGAHEYEQHGLLSLGNDDRSHFLIYNRIKQHPSYHKTTDNYKKHVEARITNIKSNYK